MIIDFHAHLAFYKLYPDKFLGGMFSEDDENTISLKKRVSIVKMFLKDCDCSLLLKQMDEANIKKTVLLIVDDNEFLGKTGLTIEESYHLHFEILKRHSDRFIIFAGYHPGREKIGINLLKKGIEDCGFSGVKLYPPYGFKINDVRLNDCYEYCDKLGLPILIHTGFSLKGLENENAEPQALGQVAEQYQNINFIMAHAGYKLDNSLIQSLLLKDNIYADISGFQSIMNLEYRNEVLKLIFKEPYNSKILYGSDWPISNMMKPLSNQIKTIQDIANNTQLNDVNALNNILYNNAEKILNLREN